MKKQTVAVDLDGVLAKYLSWQGIENIGNPIPGAQQFMQDLKDRFFVIVFTTRCSAAYNPDYTRTKLVVEVEKWLAKHEIPYNSVYSGQGKPLATAYVDDRAVSCEPMKATNPHLAYNSALWQVDRLARIAEAASDGDYIAELAKMNVAPDGTRLVPGLAKSLFPCRKCEHFVGEECQYDDGDCVIVE
jgi:hypothetical protein